MHKLNFENVVKISEKEHKKPKKMPSMKTFPQYELDLDFQVLPLFYYFVSKDIKVSFEPVHWYSQVPIKRVGPNKRVGWIFYVTLNK